MAALTADRNTLYKDGEELPFPVAANAVIYAGALVVANAAGYAAPGSAAAGLIALGRAEEYIGNNPGADGAKVIRVRRKKAFLYANSVTDAVVQADTGKPCYIQDDQTVCHTATGKSVAGTVVGLEAAGVWVHIG
ncbi:MAG: hypothetical protein V9G63_16300 [Candidatus Competibacter sp.]|jgi:hypothetical protein